MYDMLTLCKQNIEIHSDAAHPNVQSYLDMFRSV